MKNEPLDKKLYEQVNQRYNKDKAVYEHIRKKVNGDELLRLKKEKNVTIVNSEKN
jgi:hypothetical protein